MKKQIKNRINKNIAQVKNKASNVVQIEMNNYVKPSTQSNYNITGDIVHNGINNGYFKFLEERYIGSVTNSSIINDISDYIYGLGITNKGISIKELISNEDVRAVIKDYKKFGQASVEVIYNGFRKVTSMHYVDIKSVAVRAPEDYNDSPKEFYYCFDWENKNKFIPTTFAAFGVYDTMTKEEVKLLGSDFETPSSELMVIGLGKRFPYFRLPDYQSALQYCQSEEEMSNFTLSWIENGFSAGHIININKGLEDTEEGQREAEVAITNQLTGTTNAGKFFLSFNDNPEMATTINAIESTDEHQKYLETSKEAESKIVSAHRYFPILMGLQGVTGFGNNADEMNTALRVLYRKVINPMREILIDSLEKVLKINDPTVKLDFLDFEDIKIKKTEIVQNTSTDEKLITE